MPLPKDKPKAKISKGKVKLLMKAPRPMGDGVLATGVSPKLKATKANTVKTKSGKAKTSKTKISKAKAKTTKTKAKTSKAKVSKTKAKTSKAKVSKTKAKTSKAKAKAKTSKAKVSKGTKIAKGKTSKAKNAKIVKTPKGKTTKAKVQSDTKLKIKISPVLKPMSPKPKIVPSKISAKRPCIENSKLPLKQHQIAVINHMRKHRGLIVSHVVGSGKTLTSVTASRCYLEDKPDGEVIIVTPVSLQENMKKEMRAYGFDPDKDLRYKFFTIQKFATTYKNKTCKKSMLIIDEAHELRTEIPKKRKNTQDSEGNSRLSRASVAVKCAATADKVLLLTATAVYNKPQDLVNLVAMVKGIEPPGKTQFEKILDDPALFNDFFGCVLSFYDIPKDDNYPLFFEHYEEIEMTPEYYKEYRDVEERNSHLFDKKNPWRFLTGVRQASNALTECMKCEAVLQRAKEGKKMVIYSAFLTYGVRKVQEMFNTNNIKYVEVTGSMKKSARDQAVKDYNADKVKIMFITKAGGQGLDLKGTRYIIIMESAWNKATEKQVFGRAARYKSHTHLPKNEQRVDAYHLLVVKPPIGKSGRKVGDTFESADTLIKEKMESKDEEAINFLKRLYPLSIEQMKCN